jgi:hypothetical protein
MLPLCWRCWSRLKVPGRFEYGRKCSATQDHWLLNRVFGRHLDRIRGAVGWSLGSHLEGKVITTE